MSWDVLLMNISESVARIEDLPQDFKNVLGSRADMLARLVALVPNLDLSDPSWGQLDHPSFSVEFNLGNEDPIDTVMLHVRGGDEAVQLIQTICEASGWRAYDTSTGELMDFEDEPARGIRAWRAFHDRVVASAGEGGPRGDEPESD